jgi:hypothetical protein
MNKVLHDKVYAQLINIMRLRQVDLGDVLPSSELFARVLIKFVSNNNGSFDGGVRPNAYSHYTGRGSTDCPHPPIVYCVLAYE